MEISTGEWALLSEPQLREIKGEIDAEYSRALGLIWLREAKTRLVEFETIVEGSVLKVATESTFEYVVVTGRSKRGPGFSCWFLDGSVRDVALPSVISHEVDALLTPLNSLDKTPLPKAVVELRSKYQEDVFE